MADFVKLNGYSVKDALAGKSLSISGDQLSLLKADGTAASTVTIPAGSKYAILTLSDVGSDVVCTYVNSSEAAMGSAAALIDLIKAGGVAYVNHNGVIYAINYCLDGSAQGVSGYTLQAESDGNGYYTTSSSDFTLVNSIWTAIIPSSGGGAPDAIIGSIAVDMTGENITTSSFAVIPDTIAVDTMTKLRLAVRNPQGGPPEAGSLTPIACKVNAGHSVYDSIRAAVEAGDGGNISSIVLYYSYKPSGWVKITLDATYNNGLLTITSGSAATAATLLQ